MFYGALGEAFVHEMDACVATPYEALQLIEANRPGTLSEWLKTGQYVMVLNGELVVRGMIIQELQEDDVIEFVPVAAGGIFGIILGIVAIVLAVTAIVLAFTKPPETDLGKSGQTQGQTNVTEEGVMLPILYGERRTGTVVISSQRIPEYHVGVSTKRTRPNSVTSSILHAYSEGETEGLGTTTNDKEKKVIFNDTQLRDDGGDRNFTNVQIETREGADPQTALNLIQDSATPKSPAINTLLRHNTPVTSTLADEIDAARVLIRVQSLFSTSKGKTRGASVNFRIEKKPTAGGSWDVVSNQTLTGQYLAPQLFGYYFPLDNTQQWDIRVTRTSTESNDENINDAITFENVVEIIKDRVSYDGTALVGLQYDETAFGGQNPTTELIPKGKKVRIPNNYNPTTRVYTGTWDGTWASPAYTNNPAFCILDLIDNTRYGLGEYTKDKYNKFTMYALAQNFDTSVDDGKGGTEPRFTLNAWITSRKKAMQTLNEVASVARMKPLWDGTNIDFFYDQTKTVTRVITQANVVDGLFSYSAPSGKAQVNSMSITYQDAADRYKDSQVTYRDHDAIRKHGLNESQAEGFGVTSAGQALRMAKYAVLSDSMAVTFTGVEDISDLLPGELINVYDPDFMGRTQSGRVNTATTTSVTLDRSFEIESGKTYQIRCMLPDGTTEEKTVTNAVGTHTTLNVSGSFTSAPGAESVWGITASDLSPLQFIVQSRVDNGDGTYKITAVEYDATKLTSIEQELGVDGVTTVTLPSTTFVPPPENIQFNLNRYAEPGGFRQDLIVSWQPPTDRDDVVSYDVEYARDDDPVQTLGVGVLESTIRLHDVVEGVYTLHVRARTVSGESDFATATHTVEDVAPGTLASITGLELFEQGNNTVFTNRDAKFTWRVQTAYQPAQEFDAERFGADSNYSDPHFKDFIVRIYDPSLNLLREEVGLLQPEYTYTYEKNSEDTSGPRRSFVIAVLYRDRNNNVSAPNYLAVSNPQMGVPTNVSLTAILGGYNVTFDTPTNIDWENSEVHASQSSGFTPSGVTLKGSDRASEFVITESENTTWYVRVGVRDSFGADSITYSSEQVITTLSRSQFAVTLSSVFTPNAPVINTLSWTAGTATVSGPGGEQTSSIAASSVAYTGTKIYLYIIPGAANVQTTTTASVATNPVNAFLGTYEGGTALELEAGTADFVAFFEGEGLVFKPNQPAVNSVSWDAFTMAVKRGSFRTTYSVSGGNVAFTASPIYIYYVEGGTALSTSTDPADATGRDKKLLAIYSGDTTIDVFDGRVDLDIDISLDITFTPRPATDVLAWGSGDLEFRQGAFQASYAISSGSATHTGSTVYVYWIHRETILRSTTTATTALGSDRTIIATYQGNTSVAANFGDVEKTAEFSADNLVFTFNGNQVIWSAHSVEVRRGGETNTYSVLTGNVTYTASKQYIYYVEGATTLSTTTTAATATGTDRRLFAIYEGGQNIRMFHGTADLAIDFDLDVAFTPSGNTLSWDSGTASVRQSNETNTYSISSDSAVWSSGILYIYYVIGETQLRSTTTLGTAFADGNIVVGSYVGGSLVNLNYGLLERQSEWSTEDLTWTISGNQLTWTAHTMTLKRGSTVTTASVVTGNITFTASDIYVYFVEGGTTLSTTTTRATALGPDRVLLATYRGGEDLDEYHGLFDRVSTSITFDGSWTVNDPLTNSVSWSAGKVVVSSAGATNEYTITASSAAWTAGILYIYYIHGQTVFQNTTTASTASGADRDIVAMYQGGALLSVVAGQFNITTDTIPDNAITTPKLIANAVTAAKIAANTITAAEIAANTITAAEIAANTITAAEINTGAVNTDELAANAVTAAKIAANTITAAEIAANAVDTAELNAGAVTAAKIAANTITAAEIAANTITAAEIATGAVNTDELAANAVTATKINVTDLAAVSANMGVLTVNDAITMNTTGHIKGGQTAFDTGTGFFLGYSGGQYKFSLGNATLGPSVTWDGSTLSIDGTLAADIVDTDNIVGNAVTKADSSTTTGTRASSGFTTYEMVRHTQTLTSGSTAIVDMRLSGTDILGLLSIVLQSPSGFRDIILRLVRDPDGTPVELFTANLKLNQSTTLTNYTASSWSAIHEDSGHGGGSTTYAMELRSYTAGTTTLNSTTMSHGDISRSLYVLETKR